MAVLVLTLTGDATPAQADFLEPILEAKTVRYKETIKWTRPSGYIASLPAEMQKKLMEGTTSVVMMLGPDRTRRESVEPGESKTVHIWDGRQGKSISLIPDQKRATISDKKHGAKDKTPNRAPLDAAAGFRTLLLDAQEKPGVKRESFGETEMDGRRVVGVRITDSDGMVMSVWGDPKTGLPVRIETTMTTHPNMASTMSDFEFNVELDESLFSVEPPPGYEIGVFFVGHPTIDPSSIEEKDLIETFREYSRLSGGLLPAALGVEAVPLIIYAEFDGNRLQKPGAEQELAETQTKLQRGMMFSSRLPKEADAHYAGKGVSRDAADKPIFWYRPKDAKAYRVIYADLSVRDAATPPCMPVAAPEQDLIDTLRSYSELCDGVFPDRLDLVTLLLDANVKLGMMFPPETGQHQSAKGEKELSKLRVRFQPGASFAGSQPPEADAHYAGRGVSFGAADKPIFWYRPKDAKTYRVIYADLSVRDAAAPPSVPAVLPEVDLIEMFRSYSELSGGPFPAKLELVSLLQGVSMKLVVKFPLEDGQKPSAKHMQAMTKFAVKAMRGLELPSSLPPEADVHYAGRGVSLGTPNRPVFWYRPKDAKKYRVVCADLSVREVDTPPNVSIAPPEQDLIDALRSYSESSGGPFPDNLNLDGFLPDLVKQLGLEEGQKPSAKQTQAILEATMKFQPGVMFASELPSETDAHYAGKGVSLGAADKPIFWYRPKDAKKCRVVYADLSVRDADPPSNAPNAQAVSAPASPKK
jgi:outer membrane lipoprotein-sorting protein/phage-related protein